MADKVHVQAANGLWVWIPRDQLKAWQEKQDRIRAEQSKAEESKK